MVLYLVCYKKDGIEYIYHSNKKFYCAYICDNVCYTKYYKSFSRANKIAKKWIGGYVKTINTEIDD